MTDKLSATRKRLVSEHGETIGNLLRLLLGREGRLSDMLDVRVPGGEWEPVTRHTRFGFGTYVRTRARGLRLREVFAELDWQDALGWLSGVLLAHIENNRTLDDIEGKASHVYYEDVEVTVDDLRVHDDDNVEVDVHGFIHVDLQYGSNSDLQNGNGLLSGAAFPFSGKLGLCVDDKTIVAADIQVDDSGWYDR